MLNLVDVLLNLGFLNCASSSHHQYRTPPIFYFHLDWFPIVSFKNTKRHSHRLLLTTNAQMPLSKASHPFLVLMARSKTRHGCGEFPEMIMKL